jgi:hypothetical protein
MNNERNNRIPRKPKGEVAHGCAAALATVIGMVVAACAGSPAVDSWGDAGLVAEQRLIIEQQQQRLADMGAAIDEVHAGLGRAIDAVTASLDGTGDLKSQFAEIDIFVRRVIASKQRLEELQHPDSIEDAGEG